MSISAKQAKVLIQQLGVLVIDDNQFMRKLVRNLLHNIGVKSVFDAADGIAGLEMIRNAAPDVVVLDWEMPLLNSAS
jgi:two-component system, chemotaxis family, chemotaxis protein CheY